MRRSVLTLVLLAGLPLALGGPAKQPPGRAEWGQFEQLAMQPRGELSPDGRWRAGTRKGSA